MFMQNSWASKCKNGTQIYILFIYKLCIFYLWCFDVKYVQFIFSCHYYDVILDKLCNFCVLNMNIHICHSKIMYHPFKYLRCWIHKNIICINHNMKFVWSYENQISHKTCTNLWNLISLWCTNKETSMDKIDHT